METVQYIRVADVVLIAPILIIVAFKIGINTPLGLIVLAIAIGTLFYNGINFYNDLVLED